MRREPWAAKVYEHLDECCAGPADAPDGPTNNVAIFGRVWDVREDRVEQINASVADGHGPVAGQVAADRRLVSAVVVLLRVRSL
jgi:hypothetical protein